MSRKRDTDDVVLLVRGTIVILESKAAHASLQAKRQVEEYALLLHYFHKASSDRRIVPIIISPEMADIDFTGLAQPEIFPQLPTYWISPVLRSSWLQLPNLLLRLEEPGGTQISTEAWDTSPYFPVPSIIEAALALKSGLAIREIAQSEASEHEIENVRLTLQGFVDRARAEKHHAICFLTGVPGSGKTLVGLGLAHSDQTRQTPFTS